MQDLPAISVSSRATRQMTQLPSWRSSNRSLISLTLSSFRMRLDKIWWLSCTRVDRLLVLTFLIIELQGWIMDWRCSIQTLVSVILQWSIRRQSIYQQWILDSSKWDFFPSSTCRTPLSLTAQEVSQLSWTLTAAKAQSPSTTHLS